jgi:hypothetical protein
MSAHDDREALGVWTPHNAPNASDIPGHWVDFEGPGREKLERRPMEALEERDLLAISKTSCSSVAGIDLFGLCHKPSCLKSLE